MTRFLMLLAVAAVAGAMYVAAAPGSAQHAPPTWKQFTSVEKQLSALKTQLKQVKAQALDADGFIHACLLTSGVASVGLFGDLADLGINAPQTFGYEYDATPGSSDSGAPSFSTALNIDSSANAVYLQAVDPTCVSTSAASHATSHIPLRSEHTR